MSGPKSAEYSVEFNLRLERIAREQAWTEARHLEKELAAAEQSIIEVGRRRGLADNFCANVPKRPNNDAASQEIGEYNASVRKSMNELRDALNHAISAHEIKLLLGALPDSGSPKALSAAEALMSRVQGDCSGGAGGGWTREEINVDQRRERTVAALQRLSSDVSEGERLAINSLARDLAQVAEKGRFEGLELEMRRRIQHANEAARRAQADADRATCLLVQLRGLQGPRIEAIVAELKAVERRERPMARDIEDRMHAAVRVARERVDKEYVAEVVSEELARLGYEVDDGFATLFVSGSEIHLTKPKLKEYKVRLQVTPESGNFDVSMVREETADGPLTKERRIRDREMEEVWCEDFARVMTNAGKRGVSGRIVKRARPGTEPVAVITSSRPVERATLRRPIAVKRQT